jgi:hypothetical protein
MVGEDGYNF